MAEPNSGFPRGVFAPIVTPFGGESIDREATIRHVAMVAAGEPHGILVGGSGGEFIAMNVEERLELTETVAGALAGGLPMIVCVASFATHEVLRLAAHAEASGARGLLVTPPYVMRPSKPAVMRHLSALREAIDLPIMLYNTPIATGVEFSLQELVALVDADVLHGVKMSFPEAYRLRDLKATLGDRAVVYCGHDGSALESLLVGADGWISCIPVCFPGRAIALWDGVRRNDPLPQLLERWRELLPFVRLLYEPDTKVDGDPHWLEIMKTALELMGHPVGAPRPPFRRLPEPYLAELRQILYALGEVELVAADRPGHERPASSRSG